ncbi:uncharacterized protein BDZ99DRAFT_462098 [Mytilinidion resinicola]|uniref:F-box domain-containing protein n=1 Tax=Mytilinidion resinicola TaxID=574789 RepID=A0A6A6YPF4_9PEZI|nr:uncharacterized protein BDZ99DRAFT_462098 [Mytilinidion resinicola]KAF2810776.1 hypothetical protein BDZ99DRAFT_462098 [Mytilinidion resinicola]
MSSRDFSLLSLFHRRKPKVHNQVNRISTLILPTRAPPLLTPPLLALPREIRDMIYAYILPRKRRSPMLPTPHTGFTSVSAPSPPFSLQLTCRQLRSELMDAFYLIAVFEVGNLNSHSRRWRNDPDYEILAASPHLARIRHIRVRISLDRMSFKAGHAHDAMFHELSSEQSVEMVCQKAAQLANVLQNGAENLRSVTVDWWDDFGYREVVERGRVFEQFRFLDGVRWKAGNIYALKRVKRDVEHEVRKGLQELDEGMLRNRKGVSGRIEGIKEADDDMR